MIDISVVFSVIIKLIPENVTELESTHLPHTKVNLLTPRSDEGKDSFYGIASSKERSFPGGLDGKVSACDAGRFFTTEPPEKWASH